MHAGVGRKILQGPTLPPRSAGGASLLSSRLRLHVLPGQRTHLPRRQRQRGAPGAVPADQARVRRGRQRCGRRVRPRNGGRGAQLPARRGAGRGRHRGPRDLDRAAQPEVPSPSRHTTVITADPRRTRAGSSHVAPKRTSPQELGTAGARRCPPRPGPDPVPAVSSARPRRRIAAGTPWGAAPSQPSCR